MSLVTQQRLRVMADGENVILAVGNTPLIMHYIDALGVSARMRQCAATIKRVVTGSSMKSPRLAGVLHDATARSGSTIVPVGPAIHVKQRLTLSREVGVTPSGQMVSLRVGKHTLGLHYSNAFQIAQWLRLRAKEAMRNAGDTNRHWSSVVDTNQVAQ